MTEKTPRPSKRPKSNSKNPSRADTLPGHEPRRPTPRPDARRSERVRPAEPEVRVGIAAAGRETLDAIAGELAPKKGPRGKVRTPSESAPEIIVEQRPAGRETLAAIHEELTASIRDTLPTLPYGDRLPNAPGAVTPSHPPQRAATSAAPLISDAEVFEMRTFVVQKADAESLRSDAARLDFVSARLAHRLPGGSAAGVTRIDMTPWTEPETLILRVWCRVDAPG